MAFRPNIPSAHINRLFDPANATVIDESELPQLQEGDTIPSGDEDIPVQSTNAPPTKPSPVRSGMPNISVDALMRKADVQGYTQDQAEARTSDFADPNFGLYSNEAREQSETPIIFGENQQVNLAASQSAAGNLARSAVKIAAKIPLKFAEGIVYGENFLMEGANSLINDREMDMDLVTNGGLASLLEAWDSGLDEGALKVEKSAGYDQNSIFRNLSTNFTEWLGNEGGDGLAFTGSGFLGGGIASKLLKGATAGRALAASGNLARVEGLLGTSGRIASAQQAFLQRMPQAAMVAYNTLTEPLFEANDTYDAIFERAMNERDETGGYKYDEQQAKQMANRGSFNAFLYNIPAVIIPNIIESRILFGGLKGSRALNPLLREAEGRIYRKTVGDFIGGYAKQLPQNIISEGGQELAQYAISKTMNDLSAQDISPVSYQMFGEVLGNVANGLGTKEGLEAAVTGGLFGVLGGSAQVYGDMARGRRMAGDMAGVVDNLNASPMVSMSNLYKTRPTVEAVTGNDGKAMEKQGEELDLDADGNPVIDPAKVAEKLGKNSRLQKVFELRQEALEKGDASLSQFASDLGLATVAQDYFGQGAENVLRAKLLSYKKMTPQDFAAEGIHSEVDRKAIVDNVDGQLAKLENLSTVYNRIKTIYGGKTIPNAPVNAGEPGSTATAGEKYDTAALYTEAAGQYVLDMARTQTKTDLENLLVNLPPEVFRNNVITPAELENGFVVAGRSINPVTNTSADTFLRANELTSQQEEQVNEALSAYNRYSQAFAESKNRYRKMLSGELSTAPMAERLAKAEQAAQPDSTPTDISQTPSDPSASDTATGVAPTEARLPAGQPVAANPAQPNTVEPATSEPTYNVAAVASRFAGQFDALGYRTLAGVADADGNISDREVFALDADPSLQLPLDSLANLQRAVRQRNREVAMLLSGKDRAAWGILVTSLTGSASEAYAARHFGDIKARMRTDGTIQTLTTNETQTQKSPTDNGVQQPVSDAAPAEGGIPTLVQDNDSATVVGGEYALPSNGNTTDTGGGINDGTTENPEIPAKSPVPVRVAAARQVIPDDVAASLKAVSLSRLFVPKSVDRAAIDDLIKNTPADELNAKVTIRTQAFADRPANYQPVDKRGLIPVYLSSQGNGANQDTVLSVFIGDDFVGNIRPPVFYDAPQGRELPLEKVKNELAGFGDPNALLPDSELTALREAAIGYHQLFDAVRAAGGQISGAEAGISLTPSQGQFAKGQPTPISQIPALQLAGEPFYAQRTYNTKDKKYNVSAIYANEAQNAELKRLGIDKDLLQQLTENVFYKKGYRNFFTLSVTPGGDVRLVPLTLPKGEKPSANTLLAELAGDVTTGANLKINYGQSQKEKADASTAQSVTTNQGPEVSSSFENERQMERDNVLSESGGRTVNDGIGQEALSRVAAGQPVAEQRNSVLPPTTSEAAQNLMSRLTGKFNIPGQVVSQAEVAGLLGRDTALPKGFFKDGRVYLVEGLMAEDTPFHEFAHPFVAAIEKSNPVLYANLLRQIKAENSIFSKVKTLYPELSETGQLQEAVVQALGQRAALASRELSGKANENRNQLVKLLDRFLEVVRDLLQTMGGRMTKPAGISENTTLDELSKYLVDETKIDLAENPRTGIAFQKVDEPTVEEAENAVEEAETEVAGSVDKGLREAVGRQVSQLLARKQEISRQGGGTQESRLTVAARTRTINNAIERLQKEVTYDALFSVAGKQLYTAEEIFRKETVTASDLNDVLRILQSVVDYDGFLNNDLLDAAQKRKKDSIAIRRSKLQNTFKDAVITTAVKESRKQGYDFKAEDITAAYQDVGVAAQLALSTEETQIPVVKVMASLLKSADRQTQADYKAYEKQEAEIRAQYNKADFARLMEDGRLITAYKNDYYAAEDAAVQRHMDVLNADASTPQQMAGSYNKLFDWYKQNHTYEWTAEGRELFEKDRAAIEELMTRDGVLDADGYQRWLLENSPEFVGETDADGTYRVTVDAVASVDAKGELVNRKWYRYLKATPNAVHQNPRHAEVKANPLYRFITEKYIEALKKVPHKTIVDTGGFDKVMAGLIFDVTANALTLKNTFAGVKDLLGDTFTVAVRRADITGENAGTVDEKGRVRKLGIVPSVERLQEDRQFDNPLDLLKQFYKLASAYEHKQAVEPVLNLLEYQLSNTPALQTTLTGQVITNALTGNPETVAGGLQNALSQIRYARQVTLEGSSRTDATEVSLSEKERESLLSGEQQEVRKLTAAKVSDGMVDFSRMVSLGLKPFSALANVVMGLSANYVWAARGEGDFTEAQLNKAASTFFPSMAYFVLGGMPGVRAKLEKQYPGIASRTKKIAALANRYKITETLREGQTEQASTAKLAEKFSQLLYSPQTSGEYLIGTQLMLAMMDNTPVTNLKGEVRTLFDAYGEDGEWNTAEFGGQPEWTRLETLDETGLNTSRDKAFRDRLDQVRKRTQGDYQNPLLVKSKWYGRVLSMFRTWLPMAIRERFGKATGDGGFKGRYRTYRDVYRGVGGWDKRAKVLGLALLQTGVGTAYNVRNNVRFAASLVPGLNKTGLATMELGNLDAKTRDMLDAYLREQNMSELDIRNMRANMKELQFMVYATMMTLALKALDAEDGDKDKELIAMINLANRTFDDMGAFYNPDTYIQLIKKPVPMQRTIDNAVDVVDSGINLIESPDSDIYERGSRKGESKFWGKVADALPVASAIRATQNTFGQVYGEEAYKYSGD